MTTGASNDIERATDLARNMVTKWGLSDKLGPLTYSEETGEVFLGRSVTQHKQVSDVTAHAIDEEVRRVIEVNFKRAREILTGSLDRLHTMAEALMKYETLDEEQLKDVMAGKTPKPPEGWDDTLSNKPPKPRRRGRPAGPSRRGSTKAPGRAFRAAQSCYARKVRGLPSLANPLGAARRAHAAYVPGKACHPHGRTRSQLAHVHRARPAPL